MIGLEILFQVKYLPYDNPRPFLSSLFLSASISDCILRHQFKKKNPKQSVTPSSNQPLPNRSRRVS